MSSKIPQSWPLLTSRKEFEFLTHLVLRNSTGEHASVFLQDHHAGAVRFANNQIIQHVDTHKVRFLVTIGFGKKHASASTTDLTAGQFEKRSSVQNLSREWLRKIRSIFHLLPLNTMDHGQPSGPKPEKRVCPADYI